MYKSYELESPFTEIDNPKKTNIVIRCIYKHPGMKFNEFDEFYLNNLLEKLGERRAYFRKIKRPEIGRFIKKCPFWKKKKQNKTKQNKLFLIWIKSL